MKAAIVTKQRMTSIDVALVKENGEAIILETVPGYNYEQGIERDPAVVQAEADFVAARWKKGLAL